MMREPAHLARRQDHGLDQHQPRRPLRLRRSPPSSSPSRPSNGRSESWAARRAPAPGARYRRDRSATSHALGIGGQRRLAVPAQIRRIDAQLIGKRIEQRAIGQRVEAVGVREEQRRRARVGFLPRQIPKTSPSHILIGRRSGHAIETSGIGSPAPRRPRFSRIGRRGSLNSVAWRQILRSTAWPNKDEPRVSVGSRAV